MHLLTLKHKGRVLTKELPSGWDDLTLDDLYGLYLCLQLRTPVQQLKTKMVIRKLGLTIQETAKDPAGSLCGISGTIPMEAIAQLADCYDFLFAEPDDAGNCLLDVRLGRNPLEGMLPNDPGYGLSKTTYGQYQYLCHYLELHASDPDAAMSGLCNTLYDPASVTGDANPNGFAGMIRPEMKEQLPFIQTIVLWYVTGSMRLLSDQYTNVFATGETISEDSAFEAQMRLLDELTGGDVTKRDSVRQANLWDVLHNLEMRIEKNKKQNK